jgi:hypothetical protein
MGENEFRREYSNHSSATALESLLGIFNVIDKSASAGNTVVAFTREYFRVLYPLRNVYLFFKVKAHPSTPHWLEERGREDS